MGMYQVKKDSGWSGSAGGTIPRLTAWQTRVENRPGKKLVLTRFDLRQLRELSQVSKCRSELIKLWNLIRLPAGHTNTCLIHTHTHTHTHMYVDNNSWQILRVLEFTDIKLELFWYPVWHVERSILKWVWEKSVHRKSLTLPFPGYSLCSPATVHTHTA